MACEIIKVEDSVVHIRIKDIMQVADKNKLESLGTDMLSKREKIRLVVLLENFKGWEKSEVWGDVGFMMEHGDDIVRMAIVGDEKWKEQMLIFVGKGLRKTEIEFFPPSSIKKAEDWVNA